VSLRLRARLASAMWVPVRAVDSDPDERAIVERADRIGLGGAAS
jgi:hypothetical protein